MNEKTDSDKQKHQTLFMHLVMMMSSSALQHMGKTVNPMTGKTDIDLDGAAFAIDMLEMIEARTEGNLERDEDRLLKSQLANLRLNFVETSATVGKSDSGKPADSDTSPQPEASTDSKTETSAQQTPDKEPKPVADEKPSSPPADQANADESASARFHKSYG